MIALARRTALVLVRVGRSSVDVEDVDRAYGWWDKDRLIDGRVGVSGDGESLMLDADDSGRVRGSGWGWESPVPQAGGSEGSVSRKSCILAATFRRDVGPACVAGRGDSLPDDEEEDEADNVGEGGASDCGGRPDVAVEEEGNEEDFVEVEVG